MQPFASPVAKHFASLIASHVAKNVSSQKLNLRNTKKSMLHHSPAGRTTSF